MLLNDRMPDLSRYARPEQKIDALYQYVFNLRNEINHVLSNLDEENLGTTIKNALKVEEQVQEQTNATDLKKILEMLEEITRVMNGFAITDVSVDAGNRYIDNALFR